MGTEPPVAAPSPVRSRLIRRVAWLRRRPFLVFAAGLSLDLALMIPAFFADWRESYIGVPAAVTSVIVVGGALVGGPYAGVALALTTGVAFDALVITDRWLVAGLSSGIVLLVWLSAGVAAGMLGDRYRNQVRGALEQAAEAREAVERFLEVTPVIHASGSVAHAAKAVCDAALETTGCSAVALVNVEGDSLRLLAREPGGPALQDSLLPVSAFPDLLEDVVSQLRPSFIPELAVSPGPSLLVDLVGFDGLSSALRVPVVLDRRPVAILAFGWAARLPTPEPAWLATIQRFADHAAVALERARRLEAERDATRLYRRFEASLVPHIARRLGDVQAGVSYVPGERRMRLGGDFVDLLLRADGGIRGIVGDVTGHGPDAAAMGAYLRSAWRALAFGDLSAGEALGALNRLVMEESERAEAEQLLTPILATVCTLEVSPDRSAVTFTSAGHPPALVLVGDDVRTMPLGGLPLGVESCDWTPVSVPLPEEWTVILYTDGIIDARVSPDVRQRMGVEGLVSLLRTATHPDGLVDADLRRLTLDVQRMNGGPLPDDATLLAVSRSSTSPGAEDESGEAD